MCALIYVMSIVHLTKCTTLKRQAMKDGELLLVLITTNYSECHGSDYVPETILMVNGTGKYTHITVIVQ